MNSVYLQLFVIFVSLLGFIQCKNVCVHSDVACTTKAANRIYKSLVNGIENKVKTSDPLYKDHIEGNLNAMHFNTSNITMTGLRDCQVTTFLYNSAEFTGEFNIQCPKLFITWYFDIKGLLRGLDLEGKGTAKITFDDYVITYKFKYDNVIDDNDKTQHISIKNSELKTETKGKLIFNAENQVGDSEIFRKAIKLLNDDWRGMEKLCQEPFLDPLLMVFKKNLGDSLQAYPIEEILADKN